MVNAGKMGISIILDTPNLKHPQNVSSSQFVMFTRRLGVVHGVIGIMVREGEDCGTADAETPFCVPVTNT